MKAMGDSNRNAEALFETRMVTEIRQVEAQTQKEIKEKQEELRQLIGTSYRDLIESADNILLMKKSCQAVSQNIESVQNGFASLHRIVSDSAPPTLQVQREKQRKVNLYDIGSRVKYLVDTSENIWGCLDESMFLEAAGRYVRAREVYDVLVEKNEDLLEKSFPLLRHQWQLVENFRGQISQKSRDRLLENDLAINSYANALAAVAVIDELNPKQVFTLFLETRKSWLRQRLQVSKDDGVAKMFCDVVRIIQVTLCQIGELFLEVLSDLPLFYRTVLTVPPGLQLFGGIPNPDAEVQRWKSHREKLESAMAVLSSELITESCFSWIKYCAEEVHESSSLLKVVSNGKELSEIEQTVKDTIDSQEAFLEGLEWLKGVFGSRIESPWQCLCGIVLKEQINLWDTLFEGIFVRKMKDVICLAYTDLSRKVKFEEYMAKIVTAPEYADISEVLQNRAGKNVMDGERASRNAGEYNHSRWGSAFRLKLRLDKDWFNFLNSFFGAEVSEIKDTIDKEFKDMLMDLTSFLSVHKSSSRMEELSSYMQEQCFRYVSTLIGQIDDNITSLSATLLRAMTKNNRTTDSSIAVKKALFLGRISFALNFHSTSIPLILGAPQHWFDEKKSTITGKGLLNSRYVMSEGDQSILSYSARQSLAKGFGTKSNMQNIPENVRLNDLRRNLRRLCLRAHNIWISWITEVLSSNLEDDILSDDSLSTLTPLKGWEDTVLKENQETGGQLETTICLPAMPSLYISAFLFHGCQEIYRIGAHVIDRAILQLFTWRLLDKVLTTYENCLSSRDFEERVSEKGLLQVLFDIRFVADVLSGGQDIPFDTLEFENKVTQTSPVSKRQLIYSKGTEGAWRKRVSELIQSLCMKLDPIDWATYEPYLWENEKQGYQRTSVLFGFLVELNRMYVDNKVSTKTDSNTLKTHGSTPRFTLLPISTPILSAGTSPTLLQTSAEDSVVNSSWNAYSNSSYSSNFDLEDTSSLRVGTPLLKSLMSQVGSRFGEGTLRLGSMLTDTQVGRLRDKSAAAMSTFGDMLPAHAAGLLSSLGGN